jgi:hypothetical protein
MRWKTPAIPTWSYWRPSCWISANVRTPAFPQVYACGKAGVFSPLWFYLFFPTRQLYCADTLQIPAFVADAIETDAPGINAGTERIALSQGLNSLPLHGDCPVHPSPRVHLNAIVAIDCHIIDNTKRRGCLKRHFHIVSGSPWLKASIIILTRQPAEPPSPCAPPNPLGFGGSVRKGSIKTREPKDAAPAFARTQARASAFASAKSSR